MGRNGGKSWSTDEEFAATRAAIATRTEQAEEERRQIALLIAQSRYGKNLDKNISGMLDEPGERVTTATWLNYNIAEWIGKKYPAWRWVTITTDEVDGVVTVRDFAMLCYKHLAAVAS
ncbi:MAG: hypothetical protein HYV18_00705 [Gammaproteobacteria bacterium]|nr:hypothetical protein [Gammaproteobacteria bacterium]